MPPPRPVRRLIGYARVSTEDQATDAQADKLRAVGCGIIHEEHGSGASRARPVLAKLMREIGGGDVLVVVRLVRERLAAPELIKRAPRRPPEDRLMTLVAGIAIADPELTLREIASQLERMRERTPRGGHQWAASSVKHLLDRARRLGLIVPHPADA